MSEFKNQLCVKGQPKENPPGKFSDAIKSQAAPQQEPNQAQMASGNKGLSDDFGNQSQMKKPMRRKKIA